MSESSAALAARVEQCLGDGVEVLDRFGEVSVDVPPERLLAVATQVRDDDALAFSMLVDLCAVDYAEYGKADWKTSEMVTRTGYSRGVERGEYSEGTWQGSRFAVVLHLLSLTHNERLRLRVPCAGEPPVVPSVVDVWASANWFEREAFDLYGVLFSGHPDLRRILTDYGFVGHPFRKDFPLIGHVETRYDSARGRVVYEPVSIEPRTLVPRVIRHDHRYADRAPQPAGEAVDEDGGNG